MKVLVRKRAAPPIGPRSNQWKGARASQIADQRQQARREQLLSRRRRAWRVGQWLLGLAALAWGLTIATREMGPMVQGWLEIRQVEVEGIHQVTKSEIVGAARVEAWYGASSSQHIVSGGTSTGACLGQGSDGRTQAAAYSACHRSGTGAGRHYFGRCRTIG